MNFRFVEITKRESKLLCDCVLGLGYSFEQSYGNKKIDNILAKMIGMLRFKEKMKNIKNTLYIIKKY